MNELQLSATKITDEILEPLMLVSHSLHSIEGMHPEVLGFLFWEETRRNINELLQLLSNLAVDTEERRYFMCEVDLPELLLSLGQDLDKRFSLSLPTRLPSVFGNPDKLRQAFLFLLYDLQKKTKSGGCITLSARKYLDQLFIRISGDRSVSLSEPSLRFLMAQRIIESHYGQIEVLSSPHHGTAFIITLPHI